MADEKSPHFARLLKAHTTLQERLHEHLPARGDRCVVVTVDEIIAVLADYHYLKGQVQGLTEQGILLKELVESSRK